MIQKTILSALALFLLLVVTMSALAQGDFRPTETTDQGVGMAADAAVRAQAKKTNTKINLNEIIKAEDREPSLGTRDFRLCLKVNTITSKPYMAQAMIAMDQYSNFKLKSWTDGGCEAENSSGEFKPDTAFKPVENGDGGAGLAADFAVKEQAKRTKATITPATILKAEDLEPALGARNFRLCLKTTVNGKATTAQTLVNVDQYSNQKLVSWKEMNCSEAPGDGFEPVETGFTAGVDMAADWAVGKHSKDTGIPHKLVQILKREEKGMFAVTYRICMKVSEKAETQTVQAVVSVDQYSNMTLVSWQHSANCGN